LFNVAVWSAETGQANLLRELSERRVSKQRHVTKQLVHHVTASTTPRSLHALALLFTYLLTDDAFDIGRRGCALRATG